MIIRRRQRYRQSFRVACYAGDVSGLRLPGKSGALTTAMLCSSNNKGCSVPPLAKILMSGAQRGDPGEMGRNQVLADAGLGD
jgi:hypothetical protein